MFKKIMAVTLSALFLLGILPPMEAVAAQVPVIYSQSDTEVPEEAYFTTIEEAGLCLREHYLQYDENFVIYLKIKSSEFNALYEVPMAIDDYALADDGNENGMGSIKDNIVYSSESGVDWEYYIKGSYFYFTFTYKIIYKVNKQEQQEMTQLLTEIYAQLDMEEDSEYWKVFKIYNWVTSNITYDYESYDNFRYYGAYYEPAWTAYGALTRRTCVCAGYARLMCRMLQDNGIDAKYITGNCDSVCHAWNIVKIGDLYYNIDATWDAYYPGGAARTDYFLLGDDFFKDHTPDDTFLSDSFLEKHPMSAEDYDRGGEEAMGIVGSSVYWTVDSTGILRLWGNGAIPDYKPIALGAAPWYSYRDEISGVVIEEGVTAIGEAAFYQCGAETVEISDSVTSIGRYAFLEMPDLHQVHIGNGLQQLGEYVFLMCSESLEVYFTGEAPGFEENSLDGCAFVYYPAWLGSWESAVDSFPGVQWEPYCLEHLYESITVDATCTTDGSTVHTCVYCGESWLEVITATGHLDADENDVCDICGTWLGETPLGDITGDGSVDIFDANLAASFYNEIVDLTAEQLAAADVNGDGDVNIFDANLIAAYYNEVIDTFPVN